MSSKAGDQSDDERKADTPRATLQSGTPEETFPDAPCDAGALRLRDLIERAVAPSVRVTTTINSYFRSPHGYAMTQVSG